MMSGFFKKRTDKITSKNKKRRIRIICCILILLIALLCVNLYVSNNCIKVTNHTLSTDKVTSPVRIGVISDLHKKVFGSNNENMYQKLKEQNPHIILLVGDMLSCDSENIYGNFKEVIKNLSDIAPVYYSLGNHEINNPRLSDIKELLSSEGVALIDNEYRDINIGNVNIRLGGISYYRSWDEEANAFLNDFSDTDDYKILMCHFPEFYQWGIKNYPIDLTVSGHTHGGMIRFPFIGAVYAPEQGWFPEYSDGIYTEANGTLAVTTGLGSSPSYLPRFSNRPEIMIINLE